VYDLRVPNDFISEGNVRGRFEHLAAGNINHDIHIEYLKLLANVQSDVTPVVEEIIESDFPWIAIAIILMCVAYLLLRNR